MRIKAIILFTFLYLSLLHNVHAAQQLQRIDYFSQTTEMKRQYFVYLPSDYLKEANKEWPLLFFLHGNGERGNGLDELGHVLKHGPLYETWIQKRELPFVIVAPQLPMFDFRERGIDYITHRKNNSIPTRLAQGVPNRPEKFPTVGKMTGAVATKMNNIPALFPLGWEQVENDLIYILNQVQEKFNVDSKRTYLTGISYGGVGTWYMASKHPKRFAAIAPIVGWGHPSLMAPIAKHKLPVWAFAGGRDSAVPVSHFYQGLNELEKLGHDIRFTIHADMEHDAWTRVYQGEDIYNWLLQHKSM